MNRRFLAIISIICIFFMSNEAGAQHSVARLWNEALLDAIRSDFARPTVHARNLFHTAIAMYDAWAVYDNTAQTYFLGKTVDGYTTPFEGIASPANLKAAREETICYAVYRLLNHRFRFSPGLEQSMARFDSLMSEIGLDPSFTSTDYSTGSPAALGNYLGQQLIEFGAQDGANEQSDYANQYYEPVNPTLVPLLPGNPDIIDPNRWQPLTLEIFIDQSGNILPGRTPKFLSAEWGQVPTFALTDADLTIYQRDGFDYWVYHDPGSPPLLDTTRVGGLSAVSQNHRRVS